MNHYSATVSREGKWWMVRIAELDALTQARRLSEVELMARELIAVTLNQPLESITVGVTVDSVGDITRIPELLREIADDRHKAVELERHASAQAARLAKALAENNVPVRDVGAVLGVSHQRAHQLIKA